MSSLPLLRTLFRYRAWANAELLEKMDAFDPNLHAREREEALRLVDHAYVVDRIFVAHLEGAAHGLCSTNTPAPPSLQELRTALAISDRWYQDYLETVTAERLSQAIPFVFTDGDNGCMPRGGNAGPSHRPQRLPPRRSRAHPGTAIPGRPVGHLRSLSPSNGAFAPA